MARLDLTGLTALVTGASAGIGVCFAKELQARGIGKLILVARREDRLVALASELSVPTEVMACDLGDSTQIQALYERFPEVDVLVNNAGFGKAGSHDTLLASSLPMLDLNCRAVLQLCDLYLPRMLEQGRGGILNVGSTAGMIPLPSMALYGATKAFVNSFSDALRSEVKARGFTSAAWRLAPWPPSFSRSPATAAAIRPAS